ncbi:hypothetical protein MKW98_008224 [Papaver atlanticum]|uniref:Uncharacterized protein n=1 Tax=Papaver atlanticum TaxID=357466 RepID=A0AAD4RWA0_9MAGN|nr:hypothetical protein MKW98_008224 [Papaver atlanticum]
MKLLYLHVISNIKFSVIILVLLIVLNCLEEFSFEAQVIPEDEVEALKRISTKFKIPYWKNISQTSCNRSEDLNATISTNALSKVMCDYSYNSSTICHITYM